MMGLSLPHLIILALVVLLLFGRGKISELMGDFGKGVKSFKDGVADESPTARAAPPPPAPPPPAQIIVQAAPPQVLTPVPVEPAPVAEPHGQR